MPLSDKLRTVMNALTTVDGANVSHYKRPPNLEGWIVWAEETDDGDFMYADNQMHVQIINGYIEYWTKVEYDPIVDAIQDALNDEPRIGWRLNAVEYDDSTGLIYHEWRFVVI